jgi:hypothetical protein
MNILAIKNGLVVNVVAADSNTRLPTLSFLQGQGFETVEGVAANVGDSWDGAKIIPKPAPPKPRFVSLSEMVDKFTDQEMEAFLTATSTNAKARLLWELMRIGNINMDNARIASGFGALVAAGVISAQRRDEILG